MLGLWFESARAMLFLFILLNALPVPMLRQVFASLVFSCFFVIFGAFWEAFWLSFVLLEFLASLWRAGVVLLGAFGSLEPSVGSLCYFMWCLLLRLGCFEALFAHFCSPFGFF